MSLVGERNKIGISDEDEAGGVYFHYPVIFGLEVAVLILFFLNGG